MDFNFPSSHDQKQLTTARKSRQNRKTKGCYSQKHKTEKLNKNHKTALTVGVNGRHVGPVELAHQIDHHLGLVVIGRNNAHKGAVPCLIGEIFRGGGVADLGDGKQLEQILDLLRRGFRIFVFICIL